MKKMAILIFIIVNLLQAEVGNTNSAINVKIDWNLLETGESLSESDFKESDIVWEFDGNWHKNPKVVNNGFWIKR